MKLGTPSPQFADLLAQAIHNERRRALPLASYLRLGGAILFLFAVVWTTDIMAYVGGRMIGGRWRWGRSG